MPKFEYLKIVSPELLLNTMAEGVVIIDPDGIVRLWNSAMTDISGYSAAEVIGEPLSAMRALDCANAKLLQNFLEKQHEVLECVNGCECRIKGRSDESIPVIVNARALYDKEDNLLGVLHTFSDYRTVEKLEKKVKELEGQPVNYGDYHGIIGRSVVMNRMFKLLSQAGNSDSTVLLTGESGTGKELAANAVHAAGVRKHQPFIRVNCGALPETLLESELFGHVKGAFTGAEHSRIGRFEAAHNGTIFLDEIGEISAHVQVKLLRVLQEGEFERVGCTETVKVNIRIIAATNKDLFAEMKKGNFREDLYYRLKVFPVHVPALRERKDDIPALVEHFIHVFARKTDKNIHSISRTAMQHMINYSWPGNVRELEHALEYAFVVCDDNEISVDDLPDDIVNHSHVAIPVVHNIENNLMDRRQVKDIINNRDRLEQVLRKNNWNKTVVARELNISRTTLWKKIKDMGL